MEYCNCISVDAPLSFILFSASRESLHELTSYNQVCWFSSLCCRLPFYSCSSNRNVQMPWFRNHITLRLPFHRAPQGSTERVLLFSQKWFTLQRKTMQHLWVWLRLVFYRSCRKPRSLLRGFLPSFPRFSSPFATQKDISLYLWIENAVNMKLSPNRGNTCQNGFSLKIYSRQEWAYYIKERKNWSNTGEALMQFLIY